MGSYKTEQEAFWASSFGDEYTDRNVGEQVLAGNINLFSKILADSLDIKSVIEYGANIGLNLRAIKLLKPDIELSAIEINEKAVATLKQSGKIKVYHQSILDFTMDYQRDLVLIKGVLIHINPDYLNRVYESLYSTSRKYVCIAEYYNPTPVSVTYRGHKDRLFKRDFAGEMLDKYQGLKLVDYGFAYHRDNNYPQDDITWFLLEKRSEI